MAIVAPDRSIPVDMIETIQQLQKEGYINLRIGKYQKSEELYRKELTILIEKQAEEDRPIHKGSPLHMIGVSLLFQEKLEESVRFFLLAYIEDTLNVAFKLEAEADKAPAGVMLRDLFRIDPSFLNQIKEYVSVLKEKRQWHNARKPEDILAEMAKKLNIDLRNLLALCAAKPVLIKKTPIDPLPGAWQKRVFIGGDYDHLAILRDIQEVVMRSDFQPIFPYDFMVPKELIHHHDLMLLHFCRLGIFEVSNPAGQLMEIERAKDYDVDVILFYSDRDGPPHSMTSMLLTAGYHLEPYRDTPELKQKIKDWLAKK